MPTQYKGAAVEVAALNAFIKLQRAQIQLTGKLSSHLAQSKLTTGQFGVLETLYHLGPLCQHELGDKLLSSKPNMSAVIKNLERDGLVKREKDPNDGRLQRVNLSAKGRKLIEKAFPDFLKYLTGAFSVLSVQEIENLGAISKKLGLSLKK